MLFILRYERDRVSGQSEKEQMVLVFVELEIQLALYWEPSGVSLMNFVKKNTGEKVRFQPVVETCSATAPES